MSTLPTPKAYGLSATATIAVPIPAGGLTLYRLLEHSTPSPRDFEPKLSRSQAQLRRLPELFRGSISHWLQVEQAIAASERRACFVARIETSSDSLLRVALTEQWGSGHIDVWGHPAELVQAITDVIHQRRER